MVIVQNDTHLCRARWGFQQMVDSSLQDIHEFSAANDCNNGSPLVPEFVCSAYLHYCCKHFKIFAFPGCKGIRNIILIGVQFIKMLILVSVRLCIVWSIFQGLYSC